MWVADSGYVPAGQEALATQAKPFKNDQFGAVVVQELQFDKDISQIVHFKSHNEH